MRGAVLGLGGGDSSIRIAPMWFGDRYGSLAWRDRAMVGELGDKGERLGELLAKGLLERRAGEPGGDETTRRALRGSDLTRGMVHIAS
jgi:hypothetical protein